MYHAAVRWMIRRNIRKLNQGDSRPTLGAFRHDAWLSFPGNNSWANQFRPARRGREPFATHRGRPEIAAFLDRYLESGIHMEVDDILVNGPPWRTRIAVQVHDWIERSEGADAYNNRAVLFVTSSWGKIRSQEDYADTERIAALDRRLNNAGAPETRPGA